MSIGTYIVIALRLLANHNEVTKTWVEVQKGANDLKSLVPQVQASIAEATRLMTLVQDLMRKVAPELISEVQEQVPPLDVRWLQDSMNRLMGAGLAVDGSYGPLTTAAVSEFQRRHGLAVDGWAGVETIAKIVELLNRGS